MVMIYNVLVLPYLSYYSLVWHVIVIMNHISLSSFKKEHCEILLVLHFALKLVLYLNNLFYWS